GALGLHAYFERIALDLDTPALRKRTQDAAAAHPGAVAQAFHQISHFREWPTHAQLTLAAGVRALRALDELARREGIDLVTAYLPAQVDVRPQDMVEELETMTGILELDAEALGITDRLADRLIAELE